MLPPIASRAMDSASHDSWIPDRGHVRLEPGTAQVHLLEIPGTPGAFSTAMAGLLDEERERARRFHFERDQLRYAWVRFSLRRVLSRHLGVAPLDIRFQSSARGKPSILQPSAHPSIGPLFFNVSHSGRLALMAFCRDGEVGVDVEEYRPQVLTEDIASRFFSVDEQQQLRALPETEQLGGFFRCWTRKEAYIKGLGDGLSRGLDTFSVSLAPGDGCRLVQDVVAPEAPRQWRLWDLPMPGGNAGCLASPASVRRVLHFSGSMAGSGG